MTILAKDVSPLLNENGVYECIVRDHKYDGEDVGFLLIVRMGEVFAVRAEPLIAPNELANMIRSEQIALRKLD